MFVMLLSVMAVPNIPIYTAQWENNTLCSVPPDAVYFFNISDVTAYNQEEGESWSDIYNYLWLDTCGRLPSNLIGLGCCWSFKQGIFGNYQAGMTQIIDRPNNVNQLPTTTNGGSFCAMTARDADALLGFSGLYVKATGDCVQGYLRCMPSGDLHYYNFTGTFGVDDGCPGSPVETLGLSSQWQNVQSTVLGNIRARIYTVTDAGLPISWFHYFPQTQLFWSSVFEIACELGYIFATVSAFLFAIYLIRDCVVNRKRTFWPILNICTMFILGCVVAVKYGIYLNNNVLNDLTGDNPESYMKTVVNKNIKTATGVFFSLCTLALVMLTYSNMVVPLLLSETSKLIKYGWGTFIFCIYIAFDGSTYVWIPHTILYSIFMFSRAAHIATKITPEETAINTQARYYFKIINNWSILQPYWILFLFVFNVMPPMLLAFKMMSLRSNKMQGQLKILQKADKMLTFRLIFQTSVSILYFVVLLFGQLTAIYGDDRKHLAAEGLLWLCLVLHMILAIVNAGIVKTAASLPATVLTDGITTVAKSQMKSSEAFQ